MLDPDLEIKGGGGVEVGHPDPEIRTGGAVPKNRGGLLPYKRRSATVLWT